MTFSRPICEFRRVLHISILHRRPSPVTRFPTKAEVQRRNHRCLNAISHPIREYIASDMAGCDEDGRQLTGQQLTNALDRIMAPRRLILKVPRFDVLFWRYILIKRIGWGTSHVTEGALSSAITAVETTHSNYNGYHFLEFCRRTSR